MKKFIALTLIISALLGGTYFLYGFDCERPKDYNLTVVNNTGVEFSHIGLGSQNFTSILSDAKKGCLAKFTEHYFNLEDLEKNNIWKIKAVTKDNKIYEGLIDVKKKDKIVLSEIHDGKLKTNKDVDGESREIKFDILNMIKGWSYEVIDNYIHSEYKGPFSHSTAVMGKNGEISSSENVLENEKAQAKVLKGSKGYSWINIYHQ